MLVSGDLWQGTARFAWTQGATRTRWITAKLVTVGLILAVAATVTGLIFEWWDSPFWAGRLQDPAFGLYAPVFAGWTLASFALAAYLGTKLPGSTGGPVVATTFLGGTAAFINANFLRPYLYLPRAHGPFASMPPGSIWTDESFTWLNGRPHDWRMLQPRVRRLPTPALLAEYLPGLAGHPRGSRAACNHRRFSRCPAAGA
jgi:hypothetical protein